MRLHLWFTTLSIALIICVASIATAGDVPHKYGIEFRGGYNLYMDNADPNNYVSGFTGTTGYTQTEYTESEGALSGGISLLYKTHDFFSWHIGMNVIGTDSATAIAGQSGSANQMARVYMRTVEIFFTANYYWNLSPRFNLQFGAGPSFYLASLDREALGGSEVVYGDSFYSAHGRTFGFLGTLGAEFFLSDAISLRLGGGYRFALVDRFKYTQELSSTETAYATIQKGQIAYWPDSFDTFEVDFSGAFAEFGLRIYFEPNKWKDLD